MGKETLGSHSASRSWDWSSQLEGWTPRELTPVGWIRVTFYTFAVNSGCRRPPAGPCSAGVYPLAAQSSGGVRGPGGTLVIGCAMMELFQCVNKDVAVPCLGSGCHPWLEMKSEDESLECQVSSTPGWFKRTSGRWLV